MKESHIVTDPVCGQKMKPKEVQERADHDGRTYYFCSSDCKTEFEQNPERFAREVA